MVISQYTGFEVEYLVEIAAQIELCSSNFESLSKVCNRLHNRRLPIEMMNRREDLCRKRMADAYFTYAYLELSQTFSISNYQIIDEDIDSAILKHQEFQVCFRQRWFNHRCDVLGFGTVLTLDGGLKPHRMLCGAKLSGLARV